MSEFKKLFQAKRILAMILAVAMVVTMLPQTTYAATVTESNLEQSEEAETSDVADTEESSVAADAATEETVPAETAPAEVTPVEETPAADGEGESTEAPALATSISIDLTDEDKTKEYTGHGVFDSLGKLAGKVKVTVDGNKVTPEKGDLTLTWKSVQADGTLAALPEGTTFPVNAGKYNLSVGLSASEGKYNAANIENGVVFTITPAKLNVNVTVGNITAGTKAGEIKVNGVNAVGVDDTTFYYVVDDPATADTNEATTSDLAVTVSVRDAVTGTVLGAEEALLKTGDYVMDFTATFTEAGKTKANGNYEIQAIASKDVVINNLITSYVNVTLADAYKEAGKITHTYTGKEITAPVNGTDFTAKVQYDSGKKDEEGATIFTDIEGAQTVEGWYTLTVVKEYTDSEGNAQKDWEWVKMETAPVNAGTYAYRISYAGQEGVYTESYADITVVIEPMPVVIKPELASNAKFYHEMAEADVLAQIDYKVFDTAETPKEVTVDKTTIWGVSYDDTNVTQPYEPVFILQYETKDENNAVVWEDNNGAALDGAKKYRVIFGGYKAVYSASRKLVKSLPINTIVNSTELNLMVDTDYANTLSKNAVDITVEAGTPTRIDISEITKAFGGKGDSLSNPYTKVYDGAPLCEEKAQYKKAIVKAKEDGKTEEVDVVKDTHDAITYEWYKNVSGDITANVFDSRTDEPYKNEADNKFNDDDKWNRIGYDVPVDAGIYKLQISYKDEEEDKYNSSKAEVYFVIEKQPVKVALNGEYKAYAGWTTDEGDFIPGTRISDFLADFEANQMNTFAIQKINGTEATALDWTKGKDYQVSFWVTETPLVEERDAVGNVVNDATGKPKLVPDTNEVTHTCYVYKQDGKFETIKYYTVVDASGKKIYKEAEYECDNYQQFRSDAQYKLNVSLEILNEEYLENYTNQKVVIEDLNVLDEAANKTEVHKVRSYEYLNDKADITLEKMGKTRLKLVVPERLGVTKKEYDGTPFDLKAVLGDGVVKVVKADDGTTEVTDVTVNYEWVGTKWINAKEEQEGSWPEAIDAGEYELYASVSGNATYAPVREKIANIIITPKKLTLTPVVEDTVEAGTSVNDVISGNALQTSLLIEGVVERDLDGFTYQIKEYYDEDYYILEGYRAFSYEPVEFTISDENNKDLNGDNVLKGQKTYSIRISNYYFVYPYAKNYTVELKENTFTPERVASEVDCPNDDTHLTSEYLTNEVEEEKSGTSFKEVVTKGTAGFEHVITTLDAVPYSYYTDTDGNKVFGNFFEIKITAPSEYRSYSYYNSYSVPNSAMYENSITTQGGVVRKSNQYIYVIFDAAAKDTKEFDIRWEDGYVEHFTLDFSNAELMGNLAEAVAPKTLSFNTPNTKMVVGEVQDLDLKMTKVQKNDVVCIAYDVDNKAVLSVDDMGEVIALATGTATVTAYPVKIVDGQKVAIENAKKAQVKITVKDVTAPKVKKVDAKDDYMVLQYSTVTDGYRREIYVLEGNNIKPAEFESKIASMKNEQWQDIFAIAPKFYDADGEAFMHPLNKNGVEDKTTVETTLEGLKSKTPYTVYVRNVSGVRTLEDGSQVTLSYGGNTKGFATTMAQVDELKGSIKDAEYVEYDSYGNFVDFYIVNFADGKASVATNGIFAAKVTDASADKGDQVEYALPLSGDLQKYYVNPKLMYEAYDSYYYDEEEAEHVWYNNSKTASVATVDKKGNLKLKTEGWVYIKVTDTNTGIWDVVEVYVDATADKVTGNKVKLEVGKTISLDSLLTYYEGNKKLSNYRGNVIVDENLVKAFEGNEYFKLTTSEYGDAYVTAIKEGGKLQVELTDAGVQRAGGSATATATLTSTALSTVKNLKIANANNLKLAYASLTDCDAAIQFTYAGGAEAFRIEVTDGRGRLIQSNYVKENSISRIYGKDKKYYYYFRVEGLTQQSKYNVTVTPLYDEISAKPAKTTIKTTKIPATNMRVKDTQKSPAGISVYITSASTRYAEYLGSLGKLFVSGNTYTLYAACNPRAEASASDTLIWSSSNTKVATVKANAGSFFATFKALKAGETTIEVKSKVTKEVIARYTVEVTSVGDAYAIGRRYYEDNQPDGLDYYDQVQNVELKLNETAYINVDANGETWVSYTAPKDAEYTFVIDEYAELYSSLDGEPLKTGKTIRYPLAARETVFFKLKNNYSYGRNITMTLNDIKEFTKISMERGASVQSGSTTWISFTAPEDGVYAFAPSSNSEMSWSSIYLYKSMSSGSHTTYDDNSWGRCKCLYEMQKDQTVYLKVSGNSKNGANFTVNVGKFSPKQLAESTDVAVKLGRGESDLYEFTAPETACYVFSLKENGDVSDASAHIALYEKVGGTTLPYISAESTCNTNLCKQAIEVKAGEKVYVKVSGISNWYAVDATLNVSKFATKQLTEAEPLTIKLGSYEHDWVEFTAPETNCYTFDLKDNGTTSGATVKMTPYEKIGGNTVSYTYTNDNTKQRTYDISLNKGDKVYLRVSGYHNYNEVDATLKVTKLTTAEVGGAGTVVTVNDSEYAWVAFTAPEAGYYAFTEERTDAGTSNVPYMSLYDKKNGNSISNINSSFTDGKRVVKYPMAAGQTVFVRLYHYNEDAVEVKLCIEKMDTTEIVAGDTTIGLSADVTNYYVFNVTEDGLYTFTSMSDGTEYETYGNANVHGYSTAGRGNNIFWLYPNTTTGSLSKATMPLKAGDTIYLEVNNDASTDWKFNLNISKTTAQALTDTQPVTVAQTEEWYYFTAPETGYYTFTATVETVEEDAENSGYSDVYGYRYKVYWDGTYYGNSDSIYGLSAGDSDSREVRLQKGETVYWKANHGVTNAILQLSVKAGPQLTLGEGLVVNFEEGSSKLKYVTFVAPKAGKYKFYTSCDAEEYNLSVQLHSADDYYLDGYSLHDYGYDGGSWTEGYGTLDLEAGEAVFLKLYNYNDSYGYDFNVTCTQYVELVE